MQNQRINVKSMKSSKRVMLEQRKQYVKKNRIIKKKKLWNRFQVVKDRKLSGITASTV